MTALGNNKYRERHIKLYNDLRAFFLTFHDFSILDVFLYGSYSRFDGAFLTDGSLYNDIDIVIVVDSYLIKGYNTIPLRKKLATAFKVSNVDILVTCPFRMRFWKRSIFLYDLKYHSIVLYGEGKSINVIRPFVSEQIPYKDECFILASTRAYCIIKPISIFLKGELLDSSDVLFINYQLSKLVISCLDCRLLQLGRYRTELERKLDEVCQLVVDKNFASLVGWAVEFKRSPSLEKSIVNNQVDLLPFLRMFVLHFESFFLIADKFTISDLLRRKSRLFKNLSKLQFEALKFIYNTGLDFNVLLQAHKSNKVNGPYFRGRPTNVEQVLNEILSCREVGDG